MHGAPTSDFDNHALWLSYDYRSLGIVGDTFYDTDYNDVFYLTDTGMVIRRLRTSNKRRWKRRLKKYKEEYRVGNKSLEDITRSVASYSGHLAHGHTWKLRKKVMGGYVLTHAPKVENDGDDPRN
jgi:hypothetical protein